MNWLMRSFSFVYTSRDVKSLIARRYSTTLSDSAWNPNKNLMLVCLAETEKTFRTYPSGE